MQPLIDLRASSSRLTGASGWVISPRHAVTHCNARKRIYDEVVCSRRRRQLKICALATGLADKAVSLVYERVLRKDQLKLWVERCEAQIGGVLAVLEKERAAVTTPWWFGERIGHADIAVACALRFTGEGHPALFDARYPALQAHAAACEALPPFQEIVQPLAPPSG